MMLIHPLSQVNFSMIIITFFSTIILSVLKNISHADTYTLYPFLVTLILSTALKYFPRNNAH